MQYLIWKFLLIAKTYQVNKSVAKNLFEKYPFYFIQSKRCSVNSSDAFELEIGELSRAEPSWIFPSRAELVGFRNRAEPSWIFLETSWIFLGNHFFCQQ